MTAAGARRLHLVSPPARGADVLDLQDRLDDLGYAPGPLDGVYGIATASAVRAFQRDHGLTADGSAGPATRAVLTGLRPGDVPPPEPSPTGLAALREALEQLGTPEDRYGAWYGVDGGGWAAIFVSWCFAVGAGVTLGGGHPGEGLSDRGCAYAPALEAWLRTAGLWRGRTRPLPGDLALLRLEGGGAEHVGIVECDLRRDGTFLTVEADGGRVQRRTRRLDQVTGFGRIA